MKYALILALVITGCTTVPVARKFPEVPESIIQKCPELEQLKNDAKLSDVAVSITNNYTLYHQCSSKHNSFIEWYNVQKKIFEEVK